MAFKRDDSFLQYVTMGAVGSVRVARDLVTRGHQIIELERYTTSNKIWTTKIKRLRLPDLLCLRCGLRIEARAKSKLEIKVSDSPTVPGREWDAGLNDTDLVALVRVHWDGRTATPAEWVDYFQVGDLRATVGLSKLGPPKSAGEGAERDRSWPASAPSYSGRVVSVSALRITVETVSGPRRSTPMREGFIPYVEPGVSFEGGTRLVAGVVRKPDGETCPGDVWSPLDALTQADPGMRYAAVKALGFDETTEPIQERLAQVWTDTSEDPRIRLEALAALARLQPQAWVAELGGQALAVQSVEMAMEAVLILSELPASQAAEELASVLARRELPDELRAAAGWGLGIGGHRRAEYLIDFLDDQVDEVAIHSLVALGDDLTPDLLNQVAERVELGDRAAAAAAQVVARHGPQGAAVWLQRLGRAGRSRQAAWELFGLGLLGRENVEAAFSGQPPSDLRERLEPLWVGLTENWLSGDHAAMIDFVARQVVREAL